MPHKTQRGGYRPGAGRPPGSKNKVKTGIKRNVIKQVAFTPEEWKRIAAEMEAAGFKNVSRYIRERILPK